MSNPESETWSLDSSVQETVEIYGRTFHQLSLQKGSMQAPIDASERDRLEFDHQTFQMIFDNRLIFPPIRNPQKILDCGYGSGAWAVATAEEYPEAEVIGIDITPHMRPEEMPQNLWLQVDDLNEPFTFQNNEFDLVHSQRVFTGINKDRWPSYVHDCARVLKPGGWLQFVELYYIVQSDNGTITEKHAIRQLTELYSDAVENTKDLRAPLKMEALMKDAGLVELATRIVQLPLNSWSNNARDRSIGERFGPSVRQALSGYVLLPFTETLCMSVEEVQVLVAQARRDTQEKSLKPYMSLYVTIGRKPNS